jgi:hypothetical protein
MNCGVCELHTNQVVTNNTNNLETTNTEHSYATGTPVRTLPCAPLQL